VGHPVHEVRWRRMLIVGWRTFPALCPIYGWQVTTFWVNCPLCGSANHANSAFHPSGSVMSNLLVFTWISEVETIKQQTRATYGCIATGQSPWPRAGAAAYRLYAGFICDDRAAETAYAAIVVLYKWTLPLPFYLNNDVILFTTVTAAILEVYLCYSSVAS